MREIKVKVVNHSVVPPVEMIGLAARLTQKQVTSFDDLKRAMKPSLPLAGQVISMGHLSVTRHNTFTVLVIGASRRFLAQITRHHVGIDFTSGSLQYENMTGKAEFVIPYSLLDDAERRNEYIFACEEALLAYEELIANGVPHDEAAYAMPNGMRNVLLITANVEAWMNLLKARLCYRNTTETQYVANLIWKELIAAPGGEVFKFAGPSCRFSTCTEGKMRCSGISFGREFTKYDENLDNFIANRFSRIWEAYR